MVGNSMAPPRIVGGRSCPIGIATLSIGTGMIRRWLLLSADSRLARLRLCSLTLFSSRLLFLLLERSHERLEGDDARPECLNSAVGLRSGGGGSNSRSGSDSRCILQHSQLFPQRGPLFTLGGEKPLRRLERCCALLEAGLAFREE